jgi:hypothetical protein
MSASSDGKPGSRTGLLWHNGLRLEGLGSGDGRNTVDRELTRLERPGNGRGRQSHLPYTPAYRLPAPSLPGYLRATMPVNSVVVTGVACDQRYFLPGIDHPHVSHLRGNTSRLRPSPTGSDRISIHFNCKPVFRRKTTSQYCRMLNHRRVTIHFSAEP